MDSNLKWILFGLATMYAGHNIPVEWYDNVEWFALWIVKIVTIFSGGAITVAKTIEYILKVWRNIKDH